MRVASYGRGDDIMINMLDSDSERSCAQSGVPHTHTLKCWPEFFDEIAAGRKRHDLRRSDDRSFEVGDIMRLKEFDPISQTFTGREQLVEITYITSAERKCALSDQALNPSYCILSISPIIA